MHQQLEKSDAWKVVAVCILQLNKLVNSVVRKLIKAQWKQQAPTLHKLNPRKLKSSPWDAMELFLSLSSPDLF